MALEILEDDAGKYVEVDEIVPHSTRINYPVGSLIPLNDHKAYYFADQTIGKKGKAVREAYKVLTPLHNEYKRTAAEGEEEPKIFDHLDDALCALIKASLSINYDETTVNAVVEQGLVGMSHLDDLLVIVLGDPLPYKVRVVEKKTPTA